MKYHISKPSLQLNLFKIMILKILFFTLIAFTVNATIEQRNFSKESKLDQVSLLAIKSQITQDPNGVFVSWNKSVHFCTWHGVTCDHEHTRVTSLNFLSSSGLVGTLSPTIGNLTFIRNISLINNTLQGHIPPQVGYLSHLQTLDLRYNSFDGLIPANLSHCSNLLMLGLNDNNLYGRIPRELGSLPRLKILSIHNNDLEGDLSIIGNITSVEIISATNIMFKGNIPDSFGKLKNLTHLYLGATNISGIIPHSFYNLSSLIELSLASNQLEGSLLPELGLKFPHLQFLQLNDNHFTGPLPWSLSNLSEISIIEMGSNEFTGKIEIDGGRLPQLQYLNFAGNYLGLGLGERDGLNFIESLVNCSYLRILTVASNELGGVLPSATANLSSTLQYLHVGWNNISGEIPRGLGNLKNLRHLIFQFNLVTGVVPSDIGEIQSLETLSFTGNRFHGNIPSSFGNLSKLSGLYLNGNFFEGPIPSTLGNCKYLLSMALDVNNLSGKIPGEIFHAHSLSRSLFLSNNQLEGSLPSEVGELQNLALLDISNNKLSGKLPESLGSCMSMVNLYLQGNNFTGPIPSSFSYMKGIEVIDLSRNNLTGLIPSYFSGFSLLSLNLSFNNFEGNVPTNGVFANASVVSVSGNSGLCGGISALHLPKCTIRPNSRKTHSKVILVMEILCPIVLVTVAALSALIYYKPRRKHPKSGSEQSNSKEFFVHVSYNKLLKATDGFSSANLIGYGSFGCVYKGILEPNQEPVAVKVLNLQHQAAVKSFIAECSALQNIRHRNLVRIITVCSSTDFQGNGFKALVYNFMPNGSLENWLHSNPITDDEPNKNRRLNLFQKTSIAIDVATAIDYLHHGSQTPIIHCDLKPSNILLDHDIIAHVGDFGLARLLPYMPNPNESSTIKIRGTIGYAAPEYGQGSDPSREGDVYSFGILLLEMMTGKRPTDQMFTEGLTLHTYAKGFVPNYIAELIDPTLVEEYDHNGSESINIPPQTSGNAGYMECFASVVQVGVACSVEVPCDRMNLQNAIRELETAQKFLATRNYM